MINPARHWPVLVAGSLLLAATTVRAGDLDFDPYASSLYQYDSNVYKFSRQVADVTDTEDTDDRSWRHVVGLDARYVWQRQTLQAIAEGRRFTFEQFEHLDHDEYALAGVYDGAVMGSTKGRLEFRDERRMASFEDRRTTQLIMEHDRAGTAGVTVAVTPQWQVTAGARARHLRSPLPDAPALPQPPPGAPARVASPDFAVHEAGVSAGVQYGIENKEHPEDEAPLLVGALLELTRIRFSGFTPQPPPPPGVTPETFDGYALISIGATASYSLDGMSSLDAELGVTQYRPAQGGDTSLSATGEITYIRRPSVVTELRASIYRRIVPIAPTASAGTDTGIGLGAKWEPLRGLELLGDYSFGTSSGRSESVFAPENFGRMDNVQSAALSIAYPRDLPIYLKLFTTYNDRHSSLGYNDYSDFTAGVELTARFGGDSNTAAE